LGNVSDELCVSGYKFPKLSVESIARQIILPLHMTYQTTLIKTIKTISMAQILYVYFYKD